MKFHCWRLMYFWEVLMVAAFTPTRDVQSEDRAQGAQSGSFAELLTRLDKVDLHTCDGEPTIFASTPWTESSVAMISSVEPVANCAPDSPNLRYVLEVALALDALAKWSSAHEAAAPTPAEAVAAVVDYATFGGCLTCEQESWTSRCLRSR